MQKLGIVKVECTTPILKPYAKRRMTLMEPMECAVYTKNFGVIRTTINMGFNTDGRSGGILIDLLLPHFGCIEYAQAVIVHDAFYSMAQDPNSPVTQDMANEIFEFMLKRAKLSSIKAHIAYLAVASPIGDHCYNDVDKYDKLNKYRVHVRWDAK